MRGARLYLGVHPLDSPAEADTARQRLRAWLTHNPSTPLTARQAAELLGVSRSRAGVLLQQERTALNGQRSEPR
jgi:predicted XRE-type DNA-binding protein